MGERHRRSNYSRRQHEVNQGTMPFASSRVAFAEPASIERSRDQAIEPAIRAVEATPEVLDDFEIGPNGALIFKTRETSTLTSLAKKGSSAA